MSAEPAMERPSPPDELESAAYLAPGQEHPAAIVAQAAGQRPSAEVTWDGPKNWLFVKEGIHIILDRILLKDNSHLTAKCPLYGRLSRAEKRALVLRYATALVLKEPLGRDVLVDTVSMCVYEACEQEALLEAPASDPRRSKPRVPFMQKVMGEALQELLGEEADPEDQEVIGALLRQDASEVVIADAVDRMRDVWMTPDVSLFFDRLSEGDKPPSVIYCAQVEQHFGVDYFLPPIPDFTVEDERRLAQAISEDEAEAGKETVFAANLKKALKLLRQAQRASRTAATQYAAAAPTAAAGICGSAGAREVAPSAGISATSLKEEARALRSKLTASSVVSTLHTLRCGRPPSVAAAEGPGGRFLGARNGDWWWHQGWVRRYCRAEPTAVLRKLTREPALWSRFWANAADRRSQALRLTAVETCDVIDCQPLWLSLRGMVGCNLYRDNVWPIISNDGHLSFVRFRKDDRERFWYLDGGGEMLALLPLFLAWCNTLAVNARAELKGIGSALAERRLDDVSRGIQSHLENAVVAALLCKLTDAALKASEEELASRAGRILIAEEQQRAEADAERRRQQEQQQAKRQREQMLKAAARRKRQEEADRARRQREEAEKAAARARKEALEEEDRRREELAEARRRQQQEELAAAFAAAEHDQGSASPAASTAASSARQGAADNRSVASTASASNQSSGKGANARSNGSGSRRVRTGSDASTSRHSAKGGASDAASSRKGSGANSARKGAAGGKAAAATTGRSSAAAAAATATAATPAAAAAVAAKPDQAQNGRGAGAAPAARRPGRQAAGPSASTRTGKPGQDSRASGPEAASSGSGSAWAAGNKQSGGEQPQVANGSRPARKGSDSRPPRPADAGRGGGKGSSSNARQAVAAPAAAEQASSRKKPRQATDKAAGAKQSQQGRSQPKSANKQAAKPSKQQRQASQQTKTQQAQPKAKQQQQQQPAAPANVPPGLLRPPTAGPPTAISTPSARTDAGSLLGASDPSVFGAGVGMLAPSMLDRSPLAAASGPQAVAPPLMPRHVPASPIGTRERSVGAQEGGTRGAGSDGLLPEPRVAHSLLPEPATSHHSRPHASMYQPQPVGGVDAFSFGLSAEAPPFLVPGSGGISSSAAMHDYRHPASQPMHAPSQLSTPAGALPPSAAFYGSGPSLPTQAGGEVPATPPRLGSQPPLRGTPGAEVSDAARSSGMSSGLSSATMAAMSISHSPLRATPQQQSQHGGDGSNLLGNLGFGLGLSLSDELAAGSGESLLSAPPAGSQAPGGAAGDQESGSSLFGLSLGFLE